MGITLTKLFNELRFVRLTAPEKKKKVLLSFLPDIYDSSKTPSSVYSAEQNSLKNLNDSFYSGNGYAEGRDTRASDLSKTLLQDLLKDPYIKYRYNSTPKTVSESMIDNIRTALYSRENDRSSLRQAIVDNYGIESVYNNTGMHEALRMLVDMNTDTSLTYGIFLLFICAVFHRNTWKLRYFYSKEKIRSLSADDPAGMTGASAFFSVLDDPAYCNEYYVYTYEVEDDRLVPYGRLKIEPGSAVLELTSGKMLSAPKETDTFTCRPMYNTVSGLVYMLFTNKQGITRIVAFQYERFNREPMYIRTALCLSSAPRHRYPIVKKMIISSRQLSGEKLKYAQGHLKMTSSGFLISEDAYTQFLQEFKNEPWMEPFKNSFTPYIRNSAKKYYEISESILLGSGNMGINPADRLRALEGMKYLCSDKDFIPADTPDKLVRILIRDTMREK